MKHRFLHEFEDDPPHGDFDVDLDLPRDARVQFSVDGGNIWVSSNRSGWLHLARICAEMGLQSQSPPGYHFHRADDWKSTSTSGREVAFELSGDGEPA